MSAAYPNTPYRKGLAAGRAFYAEWDAWRALPLNDRPPRPVIADNPYAPHQWRGRKLWQDGVNTARNAYEREQRSQKK